MMKEQLIKAMQRNQFLNMMYLARSGEVSKRRIKIIKIVSNSFQAYCITRQTKRTFMIDSVLAVVPIIHKAFGGMISFEQRRLPKFVVYDMAVQSLQRDYKVIEKP